MVEAGSENERVKQNGGKKCAREEEMKKKKGIGDD